MPVGEQKELRPQARRLAERLASSLPRYTLVLRHVVTFRGRRSGTVTQETAKPIPDLRHSRRAFFFLTDHHVRFRLATEGKGMLPNSEMLGGTAWRPSKGIRNCIGKRSAAAGASRAAAVVSEASRVAEGPQPKSKWW